MSGKAFLVGAGPGDPELLTVKALRVLQTADVVLHDDLVSREVLDLISPAAQVRNVGKRCGRKAISQEEINALLVAYASFGLQVVRLKSGDPLLFGRAGEEMEALRRANIEFEVVPGVTAGLGAAAVAQVSLTHRDHASAVLFLSNHLAKSGSAVDLHSHITSRTTLVIYMPGHDYEETANHLLSSGLEAHTACAIVSRATARDEKIHRTTVGKLPSAPRLPAPTLLIVGPVVGLGDSVSRNRADKSWEDSEQDRVPVPDLPALDVFVDHQVFWGD